jgi:ferredoxin
MTTQNDLANNIAKEENRVAKVRVNHEACSGHGRCYSLAPEVFDADDAGRSVVIQSDVSGDLLEKARLGESNCPEGAITLDA